MVGAQEGRVARVLGDCAVWSPGSAEPSSGELTVGSPRDGAPRKALGKARLSAAGGDTVVGVPAALLGMQFEPSPQVPRSPIHAPLQRA